MTWRESFEGSNQIEQGVNRCAQESGVEDRDLGMLGKGQLQKCVSALYTVLTIVIK